MFTDMFTPCSHHVYTMFENMFPPNLKICLHNVRGHVCNIFEDKLKPCSKTCFHRVYIDVYTMLKCIFQPYLKIFFHNVGGHVCNIFGDIFLPLDILWRFLRDILLQFFKSENVNYIIFKYLEIENKSKICLTNLDFVQSYAPMHKFCACFCLLEKYLKDWT